MMWWGFREPETQTSWQLTSTAQMERGLFTAGATVPSGFCSNNTTHMACLYSSVATPAQVARCDVSKVKALWEHTGLLFEVKSLRAYLCKLAWQRSSTRYTVSLLVRGQRRLFTFQMQLLFSDCLRYREWSHVAVGPYRIIDETHIVHLQLNFSALNWRIQNVSLRPKAIFLQRPPRLRRTGRESPTGILECVQSLCNGTYEFWNVFRVCVMVHTNLRSRACWPFCFHRKVLPFF